MCSPEAGAVLNVVSAFAGYQDKKEQARNTQASNTVAKANASKGLHDDYGFIDWQKGEVKDEKTRVDLQTKIEKIAKLTEQLNLNVGSSTAIRRDVGTDFNYVFVDNDAKMNRDLVELNRKEIEAFGAYERVINDLPVPYEPSKLGLAINIANAGYGYEKDVATMKGTSKLTGKTYT